jgi:hypothetical protein
MKNKKWLIAIIGIAVLIKIFLFCFASVYVPQSKFMFDSSAYLKTGEMLATQGTFAQRDANGKLIYELRRTPGYPLFLALLNGSMKVPLSGIVFIQIILTITAALFTYKAAVEIAPSLGFLSAIIVLYSPVISIYSLMILSESLFLFLMTLFMFHFIQYLKNQKIKSILWSSLILVLAAYVRPGAYFLGMFMAFFLIIVNVRKDVKKTVGHVFILLVVVYGLLGIWQVRNYMVSGHVGFCTLLYDNPHYFGLYKSYSRNTDLLTKSMAPLPYYINVTSRCFVLMMTSPGSFKYFHCNPLTIFGKIFGYVWIIFCMTGFLYGITKIKGNIYFQFLLLVITYFVVGSIWGVMWSISDRFRLPIEPFIAIISAYGWIKFVELFDSPYCLNNWMDKRAIYKK